MKVNSKLADYTLITAIWISRLILVVLLILASINSIHYLLYFLFFFSVGVFLLWLIRKYKILLLVDSGIIIREWRWGFWKYDEIINYQDIQFIESNISPTATKNFVLIYGGWNTYIKPSELKIHKSDGVIFVFKFYLPQSRIINFTKVASNAIEQQQKNT